MKHIIKKLALLFVPVYLWFAFFVAFEPNNYFGIKKTASSSQPVARVRAYEQSPGTNLIIGDSRLAHFDMDLVDSLTGQTGWPLLTIPAIICFARWRSWTRMAGWSARRICSPSGPSSPMRR